MSYLERHPGKFEWVAPVQSLLRHDAGCVQCGASLATNDFGKTDPSGKCFNCTGWVSDEDEVFEDLDG